jgi:hypothetical protein
VALRPVDEGIALWFGFGKRRFLARDDVTVRVDLAGVRVLPDSEHFGYPLTDGISNRRLVILRAVLEELGFRVLRQKQHVRRLLRELSRYGGCHPPRNPEPVARIGRAEVRAFLMLCFELPTGAWRLVHRHADPITTPQATESVIQS